MIENKASDKELIDAVTTAFLDVFTNTNRRQPDFSIIFHICIPETIIIKKSGPEQTVYNLAQFIEPRKKILTDGTLTDFEEKETQHETRIIRNIAQRFSAYEKSGCLNGNRFHEYGHKFFQLIKTPEGWKINAVIWEDEMN